MGLSLRHLWIVLCQRVIYCSREIEGRIAFHVVVPGLMTLCLLALGLLVPGYYQYYDARSEKEMIDAYKNSTLYEDQNKTMYVAVVIQAVQTATSSGVPASNVTSWNDVEITIRPRLPLIGEEVWHSGRSHPKVSRSCENIALSGYNTEGVNVLLHLMTESLVQAGNPHAPRLRLGSSALWCNDLEIIRISVPVIIALAFLPGGALLAYLAKLAATRSNSIILRLNNLSRVTSTLADIVLVLLHTAVISMCLIQGMVLGGMTKNFRHYSSPFVFLAIYMYGLSTYSFTFFMSSVPCMSELSSEGVVVALTVVQVLPAVYCTLTRQLVNQIIVSTLFFGSSLYLVSVAIFSSAETHFNEAFPHHTWVSPSPDLGQSLTTPGSVPHLTWDGPSPHLGQYPTKPGSVPHHTWVSTSLNLGRSLTRPGSSPDLVSPSSDLGQFLTRPGQSLIRPGSVPHQIWDGPSPDLCLSLTRPGSVPHQTWDGLTPEPEWQGLWGGPDIQSSDGIYLQVVVGMMMIQTLTHCLLGVGLALLKGVTLNWKMAAPIHSRALFAPRVSLKKHTHKSETDVFPVVKIRNVNREGHCKGDDRALHDISFDIGSGEKVAVVGLSSAGKTTLVKIITGQIRNYSGHVLIDGRESWEFLRLHGNRLRNHFDVSPKVNQLLFTFNLHKESQTVCDYLSLSGVRSLQLAIAYMNDPFFVVIDEPFAGLSKYAAGMMESTIEEKFGTTLICTRSVRSALQVADRLVLLSQGTVVFEGTGEQLKESFGAGYLLTVGLKKSCNVDSLTNYMQLFEPRLFVLSTSSTTLTCVLPDTATFKFEFFLANMNWKKRKLKIYNFSIQHVSMDDLLEWLPDVAYLRARLRQIEACRADMEEFSLDRLLQNVKFKNEPVLIYSTLSQSRSVEHIKALQKELNKLYTNNSNSSSTSAELWQSPEGAPHSRMDALWWSDSLLDTVQVSDKERYTSPAYIFEGDLSHVLCPFPGDISTDTYLRALHGHMPRRDVGGYLNNDESESRRSNHEQHIKIFPPSDQLWPVELHLRPWHILDNRCMHIVQLLHCSFLNTRLSYSSDEDTESLFLDANAAHRFPLLSFKQYVAITTTSFIRFNISKTCPVWEDILSSLKHFILLSCIRIDAKSSLHAQIIKNRQWRYLHFLGWKAKSLGEVIDSFKFDGSEKCPLMRRVYPGQSDRTDRTDPYLWKQCLTLELRSSLNKWPLFFPLSDPRYLSSFGGCCIIICNLFQPPSNLFRPLPICRIEILLKHIESSHTALNSLKCLLRLKEVMTESKRKAQGLVKTRNDRPRKRRYVLISVLLKKPLPQYVMKMETILSHGILLVSKLVHRSRKHSLHFLHRYKTSKLFSVRLLASSYRRDAEHHNAVERGIPARMLLIAHPRALANSSYFTLQRPKFGKRTENGARKIYRKQKNFDFMQTLRGDIDVQMVCASHSYHRSAIGVLGAMDRNQSANPGAVLTEAMEKKQSRNFLGFLTSQIASFRKSKDTKASLAKSSPSKTSSVDQHTESQRSSIAASQARLLSDQAICNLETFLDSVPQGISSFRHGESSFYHQNLTRGARLLRALVVMQGKLFLYTIRSPTLTLFQLVFPLALVGFSIYFAGSTALGQRVKLPNHRVADEQGNHLRGFIGLHLKQRNTSRRRFGYCPTLTQADVFYDKRFYHSEAIG
ncbi:hypothetical protein PoB_001105800, partial [Plakobranchus ocellatus]